MAKTIDLDYYKRILQRVIDIPKTVRAERAKQLRVDISAIPVPDSIVLKLDPNDTDKITALKIIIDWKEDWDRGFCIELNEACTKMKYFERFLPPMAWDKLDVKRASI